MLGRYLGKVVARIFFAEVNSEICRHVFVCVCVCVCVCFVVYFVCVSAFSVAERLQFFAVDNSQCLHAMGGPARALGRSLGDLGLALGGPGRCLVVCTWRGLERPCRSLSVPRGGFGGHGLRACRCDGYCSPLPFCSIAFSTDSEVVIDKCQIPC